MSGSIKVGGHTVFVHTGASGAGTLSVQGQNGNTLLTDDGTAVHLGNNVRLPASGGIKDSSGNNILTESGGNVSVGNIRLPASGGIKDSSGNNVLSESGGVVSIGSDVLKSGSILQVQSTTLITNASTTNGDATGIGSDIGLNVTITPKSSNSKFLVQVDLGMATILSGNTGAIILSRDGTKVGNGSQQTGHPGTFFRFVDHAGGSGNDTNHGVGGGNHYLDTNSGTKGVLTTFKAGLVTEQGTAFINRNESNATSTNDPYTSYTSSTITVTEIEK